MLLEVLTRSRAKLAPEAATSGLSSRYPLATNALDSFFTLVASFHFASLRQLKRIGSTLVHQARRLCKRVQVTMLGKSRWAITILHGNRYPESWWNRGHRLAEGIAELEEISIERCSDFCAGRTRPSESISQEYQRTVETLVQQDRRKGKTVAMLWAETAGTFGSSIGWKS